MQHEDFLVGHTSSTNLVQAWLTLVVWCDPVFQYWYGCIQHTKRHSSSYARVSVSVTNLLLQHRIGDSSPLLVDFSSLTKDMQHGIFKVQRAQN